MVLTRLLLAFTLLNSLSFAGEGLFSRVYTTETVPGSHWELEQLVRNRLDRSFGSYSAYDLRSEVEYGFTDNFQGAFYFNTGYINAKGAPDDDDPNGATGFTRNQFFVEGISTELIYRVLSPVLDPVGLAFYIEPEYDFSDPHNGLPYSGTFSTEYRILLQKNFWEDQLILALNVVAEIEFIRFRDEQDWKSELDWNNEFGVTYRVGGGVYAGLELRNHNEIGNFITHEHSVLWAGPAVHYAQASFWTTLGVLKQVYGDPSGTDANGTYMGSSLFLRSHENWEVTAKIGVPF